jgi:ABC-type transport system involved in multi-copper enzyme maturation permease subunit
MTFAVAYLIPVVLGKSDAAKSFGNFAEEIWWVNAVFLVFNGFISGLFPLLIGGFISSDSLASEFDKNTIVPLLSQPIRRAEIYLGKLLEKLLLMLIVSVLLTALAIVCSQASVGGQLHLEWFPLVALVAVAAFVEYTALAFFFGSFLRSGSMVLGILISLFFGLIIGIGIVSLKTGFEEWMGLLPMLNDDVLTYIGLNYVVKPSGIIAVPFTMGSMSGPMNTVSIGTALQYALAGLAINIAVPLAAGYCIFRRAEVTG